MAAYYYNYTPYKTLSRTCTCLYTIHRPDITYTRPHLRLVVYIPEARHNIKCTAKTVDLQSAVFNSVVVVSRYSVVDYFGVYIE